MKSIDFDILAGQKFYNEGYYAKCVEVLAQDKYLENEDVLLLLASAYKIQGKYEDSLNILAHISEFNPQYVPAYIQQAYIYISKQLYQDEIELLHKIISLIKIQRKNNNTIYVDKLAEVYSMLGSAYVKIGKSKKACSFFLSSSELEKEKQSKIKEYSNALFTANYIYGLSNEALYKLHIRYQKFFDDIKQYDHVKVRQATGKIKVGYLSPDFRNHPVMAWTIKFLLEFNKDKFKIYCYSTGNEDELTEKLKKLPALNWRNINGTLPQQAADYIYNDRIDILFDLSGHTANNCLPILAYKPAPVQISGIGYFNTTGLQSVDYFLSDEYCLPDKKNTGFIEKVICMPQSHMCYTSLEKMPNIAKLPFLKNNYITFGCFNNFNKVNAFILQLWSQILDRMPTARLILKSQLFNSEQGKEYAFEILKKYNLPTDRIELRMFSRRYLNEYNEIDIALDTFPYTGGVTSCESLYMGVPVITLCGKRHGSRFGYSILKNISLENCIAYSPDEYIEKAILLANNREKLTNLRQILRLKMEKSPLMDGKKYMQCIENIFEKICNKN